MTQPHWPNNDDERRFGPIDRRVTDLETKYNVIIHRLDTIDETLTDLTTLKNQISGVLIFLKFVGLSGIVTIAGFILRYIILDMAHLRP